MLKKNRLEIAQTKRYEIFRGAFKENKNHLSVGFTLHGYKSNRIISTHQESPRRFINLISTG